MRLLTHFVRLHTKLALGRFSEFFDAVLKTVHYLTPFEDEKSIFSVDQNTTMIIIFFYEFFYNFYE